MGIKDSSTRFSNIPYANLVLSYLQEIRLYSISYVERNTIQSQTSGYPTEVNPVNERYPLGRILDECLKLEELIKIFAIQTNALNSTDFMSLSLLNVIHLAV